MQNEYAKALSLHQSGRLDEARPLYQKVIKKDPRNADAHQLLGLLCFQKGKPAEAKRRIRHAISLNPKAAVYHDNLGVVLESTGEYQAALKSYESAERYGPPEADRLFNKGIVLERLQRLDEAEAAYLGAIALRPDDSAIHFNLGNLLKSGGRLEDALERYKQAARFTPVAKGLHVNQGNTLMQLGRYREAAEAYRSAVAGNGAPALAGLGKAENALGHFEKAVEAFHRLQAQDAMHPAIRPGLVAAYRYLQPRQHRPEVVKNLLLLFNDKSVDCRYLARLAANQLGHQLIGSEPSKNGGTEVADSLEALAGNPLLIALLTRAINTDAALEGFLQFMRRRLLEAYDENGMGDAKILELATALAIQNFYSEYVHVAEPAEEQRVSELVKRLETRAQDIAEPGVDTVTALVIVAMYRPLLGLGVTHDLVNAGLESYAESFRELVRISLAEPLEERKLGAEISVLGELAGDVSGRVREQYEENPYPRWVTLPQSDRLSYADYLARLFPHFTPPPRLCEPVDVLSAGCGTGWEAAGISQARLISRVTCLDLSTASLSYALRKSRDKGLDNMDFIQGDILNCEQLGRQFDVIESSGVLHHMLDPLAGWRKLVARLAPGGVMKIGLYSEQASQDVLAARKLIENRGIPATPEGIRGFRQDVLKAPTENAVYSIRYSDDFYSMSACRDLLFHVQEQCFTIETIGDALRLLGLEFIGFELHDPSARSRYLSMFPTDHEMTDLANWSKLEARYPETFAAMYVFWCRRAVDGSEADR